MFRALLFSGGGDYVDPWHPFGETSAALAELGEAAGLALEVFDRVAAFCEAAVASSPRLLIVNAGTGFQPTPSDAELSSCLLDHLAGGGSLFVSHTSATLFGDLPAWEAAVGGRWVEGHSFHPERGESLIRLEGDHPLTDGLADFTVDDERYTDLRVDAGVRMVAWHEYDGARHPLIWTRESGAGRVVYDGLGHDGAAYLSSEHRELVVRALRWQVAGSV